MKCTALFLLLGWCCGLVLAQETTTTRIAPLNPLVITVPTAWREKPTWDGNDFRFLTPSADIFIYSTYQQLLEQDEINPNDLDLALKLFPFQRLQSGRQTGRRSLMPAGWVHQTQQIEYADTLITIRDYSTTPTPVLELLRVLDNGIMVLMQVNFNEPNITDFEPYYAVLASARMTTGDEFTCLRSDFGSAPIYAAPNVTSEVVAVADDVPVLNYFFAGDTGWFTVGEVGFVRFRDRDPATFRDDCYRAPFKGERIEPIDATTVALEVSLPLNYGYRLYYPAADSWHVTAEGSKHHLTQRYGAIAHIQNYIQHVSFQLFNENLLLHWEQLTGEPIPYLHDCQLKQTYETYERDGETIHRLLLTEICSQETYSMFHVAVVIAPDLVLAAQVTLFYPERPLALDTTLVERMLLSVEQAPIGEMTCSVTTTREATLYANPAPTSEVMGTVPSLTELELQAFTATGEEDWWLQTTAGDWISLEATEWEPACSSIPRVDN